MSSTVTKEFIEQVHTHLESVQEKLNLMKELVAGVAESKLGGVIVRGEPGVGKTYEITDFLDKNYVQNEEHDVEVFRHTGHITPLQFYHILGDKREKGCISIFDDCDTVFNEGSCLNILKAAVDTDKRRYVCWQSASKQVRYQEFNFHGGLIIVTNSKIESVHYKALLDRIHYYDMKITREEKMAKIWWIATNQEYSDEESKVRAFDVCMFLIENQELIDDLSVRTFIKMIELARFSKRWKELAMVTLFKELKNGKSS